MSELASKPGDVQQEAPVKPRGTRNQKVIAIRLDDETYDRVMRHKEIFGTPLAQIAARSIREWLDVTGDARMEAVMYHVKGDIPRVPVPAAAQNPSAVYSNQEQVADEMAGLPLIEANPDLHN